MTIRWTSVVSSNLEAIAYPAPNLLVRFKGGSVYSYAGVPQEIYADLLIAGSAGEMLNSRVKGKFVHTKIS